MSQKNNLCGCKKENPKVVDPDYTHGLCCEPTIKEPKCNMVVRSFITDILDDYYDLMYNKKVCDGYHHINVVSVVISKEKKQKKPLNLCC